jgi:hypothetical protein
VNIQLTHRFLITAHDLGGLLDGCNKLSTFCTRLERQSTLFPDRYDPEKYKGDGLELFTEALIKLAPYDNRIGIGNYRVVEGQDVGVDGVGVGANGKPATVQVKYRGHPQALLTANNDHLSNFTSASMMHEGVDPNDTMNMLIITTAKGLHFFTDAEMYRGKVRCLGQQELRSLVDNNILFWDCFRELCGL